MINERAYYESKMTCRKALFHSYSPGNTSLRGRQMLFIMDIIPRMKSLKNFKSKCDTCQYEGTIELLKSYQCFRLFFIPLFKWHVQYYLKHSCGGQVTISEKIAIGILHGRLIINICTLSMEMFNQSIVLDVEKS